MNLRSLIFSTLKIKGPLSFSDIIKFIPDYDKDIVSQEINNLISDGLLKKDDDSKLHISIYLDARKIEDRIGGIYKYHLIRGKMTIDPAQSRPSKWINENVYAIVRRDQGERGTCVGQAIAYAADLNAIKLTDWRPDLSQTVRDNVMVKDEYKFIIDNLPEGCASAECAFILSRETGNIKPRQRGSFVHYAMHAWYKSGICPEYMWWTPKSGTSNNYEAYPESRDACASESELHKIEGYAAVDTFESVKDAIYNNGFVVMPIKIYSNWLDNNCAGIFPEPDNHVIGSHALCWVGYDDEHLYCIHSWNGWTLLGGISKSYYEKSILTGYVPLDTTEVMVARDTHCKLVVTTDTLCDIIINEDVYRKTRRVVCMVAKNTAIDMVAVPVLMPHDKQYRSFNITIPTDVEFTFTPIAEFTSSIRNIWEKIISLWRH